MSAGRRIAAIVWLLAVLLYCLAHPVYSHWWMLKTVLVGAFVFGLIWPGKPKEEEPENN